MHPQAPPGLALFAILVPACGVATGPRRGLSVAACQLRLRQGARGKAPPGVRVLPLTPVPFS